MIKQLYQVVMLIFNPIILIPIIIIYYKNKKYKEGTYYKATKISYFNVIYNTGRLGEYLIYKYLKKFEERGAKFLFNVYVPKNDEETTEIDVLMISSKGLFVFESKNYSGWIFGCDDQKYWYQTLPSRKGSQKEKFYNPVWQNNTHITYLKSLIGNKPPIYSIITFSNRCTLKHVNIENTNVNVINRYHVYKLISSIYNSNPNDILSVEQIDTIYNNLYPYSQVDDITKQKHIDNINSKITGRYNTTFTTKYTGNIQNKNEIKDISNLNKVQTKNSTQDDAEKNIIELNDNNQIEKSKLLTCPKCGNKLLLKVAKYGKHTGEKFYGCSNYPKCKYIRKI